MKFKPTNRDGGVVVELGPKESQLPAPSARPEFKLKKILVPVDFSECSRKALEYALPFARQFNAKLVLLHVIEPIYAMPEMSAVNFDVLRKSSLKAAQDELKALKETIPMDVATETIVREGSPYAEISVAIKELGVDLVIISTHGRTGLAHVFMGSNAERVVRTAGCPVLTVREREHEFVVPRFAT